VATSGAGSGGKWTQMLVSQPAGLIAVLQASSTTASGLLVGKDVQIPQSRQGDREFVFVDVSAMNSILHHEPQDQVISVQAGITLQELNSYLAPYGQWFPVCAPGETTLLDLINRGDGGPFEYGYGPVRDLVLGLDSITGGGTSIKSGGIVVKNVTGYDTTKLIVGSHGTLAIPYAAHLRLYARPEKTASVIFHSNNPEDLLLLAGDLIGADLALVCCEMLDLTAISRPLDSTTVSKPFDSTTVTKPSDRSQLPESLLKLAQRWSRFGLVVRLAGPDELIKELIPQVRNFKRDGTTNSELSSGDSDALIQYCANQRYPHLELSASISEFQALLSDWLPSSACQSIQYRPATGRAFLHAHDLQNLIELNDSLKSYLVRKTAPNTVAMAASRWEYEIEYLGFDVKSISQIKASLKQRFDPSGCLNPLAVL
jgi:FAD binding domain